MPNYVNWLRHASPYINSHWGRTFVVMLPGEGVEHPNFGNIVHDLVLLHSLGARLVLVHGSRPQIEARLA
ncbi:amino-acid N-acetyltransferase, partial [Acinetobacter baumannii]|nr:amino-acid N-acetyltransferase [Acinetobacter baumannii]